VTRPLIAVRRRHEGRHGENQRLFVTLATQLVGLHLSLLFPLPALPLRHVASSVFLNRDQPSHIVEERKSSTARPHHPSAKKTRILKRLFPLPLISRTSTHRISCWAFHAPHIHGAEEIQNHLAAPRIGEKVPDLDRGFNSPAGPVLASARSGLRDAVHASPRPAGSPAFLAPAWTGPAGGPGKRGIFHDPLASYHILGGEWVSGFGLQLDHYWELSVTTTTHINRIYPEEHWKNKANKIIQKFC